jgi:acyl-CoA reductase-like NAD-dependent aldehyde dehydrogenase
MTVDESVECPADTVVSRDVATGDRLAEFPVLLQADVDPAVHNARTAAELRSNAGYSTRRRAILGWAREIVARSSELISAISRENGKPADDAYMELAIAVEHIAWAARNAKRVLQPRKVPTGVLMANYAAAVHYQPYGVIGIISPWNYPLFAPIAAMASALAAGNTVVLKPSEYATLAGTLLVDCFRSANRHLPRSVVELVTATGAPVARSWPAP